MISNFAIAVCDVWRSEAESRRYLCRSAKKWMFQPFALAPYAKAAIRNRANNEKARRCCHPAGLWLGSVKRPAA
jgi:hypothetical protein